jgi:hypothetical protein
MLAIDDADPSLPEYGLLDLPEPLIDTVLRKLEVAELCAVSRTCSYLQQLAGVSCMVWVVPTLLRDCCAALQQTPRFGPMYLQVTRLQLPRFSRAL